MTNKFNNVMDQIKINIKDSAPFRKIGFHLFLGAMICFSIVVVIGSFAGFSYSKINDSDISRFNRSGLSVYTDNKTGLQYLSKGSCLTPRLDSNGNQIVNNNDK